MGEVFLSVVVPIYNGEKYLERLTDVFLKQNFEQCEVILVDDGSTDGTYQICEKYAENYSWIRVLHTENHGVSHARNTGIQEAKGDWIHFIDVDDMVHSDLFEKFSQIAVNEDPDVIICGCIREEIESGKQVYCGPARNQILNEDNVRSFFHNMKMEQRYWSLDYIWNKWYRREIIIGNHILFNEALSLGEDFVFNTMYFRYISSIALVAEPYYHYQINGMGLVSKFQSAPWIGSGILYEEQTALYKSLGLWEQNCKEIEYQAGQIAFGDIRMVNSPKCKLSYREKKFFIQNMIQSKQFPFCLNYLKEHSSIVYKVYYYIFASKNSSMILMLITLEKFLNMWRKCR